MAALPASRLLLPREADEGWSQKTAVTCTLRRSLTFSDRSEFGWNKPRGSAEMRRYCSLPRGSERPEWCTNFVSSTTNLVVTPMPPKIFLDTSSSISDAFVDGKLPGKLSHYTDSSDSGQTSQTDSDGELTGRIDISKRSDSESSGGITVQTDLDEGHTSDTENEDNVHSSSGGRADAVPVVTVTEASCEYASGEDASNESASDRTQSPEDGSDTPTSPKLPPTPMNRVKREATTQFRRMLQHRDFDRDATSAVSSWKTTAGGPNSSNDSDSGDCRTERRLPFLRDARISESSLSQTGKEWPFLDDDDYRRLVFLGSSDSEGEGERLDWDYFESGPVGSTAVISPLHSAVQAVQVCQQLHQGHQTTQLVPVPFPVPVPVFVPVLFRRDGDQLMPSTVQEALQPPTPSSPAIQPESLLPTTTTAVVPTVTVTGVEDEDDESSALSRAPPHLIGIMSQFIEEERKVYSDLEALCQEAVNATADWSSPVPVEEKSEPANDDDKGDVKVSNENESNCANGTASVDENDWVENVEWSGTESAGDNRLEEGLADDDSWLEVSTTEEEEEEDDYDEEPRQCQQVVNTYYRAAIDLTLHTIVEESCEESELEPAPTGLEKYFFYGLGGGEPQSETSSVCSEPTTVDEDEQQISDGQQQQQTQSGGGSSRLEQYFLTEFMGFGGRRDSDGSVGSDSEGRPSPSQRRKRLVRGRPTSREITEPTDTAEPFTEGQFDTVKRTKKKKRSSAATSPADGGGSDNNNEGSGRESDSGGGVGGTGKHESRDSGFMGSQDDLETARSDIQPRPVRPPRPIAAALARNDSFSNWSSDEETNLMMNKMRAFFKTMVGARQEKGGEGGGKPAQLAYFESELTRLMKSVPGLKEEQVKEIVEYLSSEDTWSDSYDSSDYTGSDLEGKVAAAAAAAAVATNAAANDSAASAPLMERVMQHIGTRLVALMHEVSGGEPPPGDEDHHWPLPRSKSHDPLLEESRVETSDNERFSWRGSFESALLAGADSRTGLGRRSAGDLAEEFDSAVPAASSLPRLPTSSPGGGMARGEAASLPRLPTSPPHTTIYKSHSAASVKSARYRAPGYRPAPPRHRYRNRHHNNQSGGEESEANNSTSGNGVPAASSPTKLISSVPDDSDNDATLPRAASLKWRSDSLASVYSGAGEGRHCGVTVRGEVQFGLEYNYKLSSLEIHVKQCRDLAAVDTKRNRSDPYVKVYLLPDKSKSGKRKTKVKKHTLNPVFEETLRFQTGGTSNLEGRTLWLSVWHSDMFGRNDFLGEVLMPLENKVFDDPLPKFYPLQERSEVLEELSPKGELIVGLKFVSEGNDNKGSLYILIKEAKNLPPVKTNGTSDPFCKSYLLPDKSKSSKRKAPVASKTCNPVWNHTLKYDNVTLTDLMERSLELTVWHHDRLASNEFLGGVRLSLGTGRYKGRLVDWMDSTGNEITLWQRMADKQNFWVESCLPLRPSLDTVRTTSSSLLHNTL